MFLTVRDSSKYDGVSVSNPSANATPLSVALSPKNMPLFVRGDDRRTRWRTVVVTTAIVALDAMTTGARAGMVRVETTRERLEPLSRSGETFETTYASVGLGETLERALEHARGVRSTIARARGGNARVVLDGRGVEDAFELAYAHREKSGEVRGEVLRRIRGGDGGEGTSASAAETTRGSTRVGTFAPNARGGVTTESITAATGAGWTTFADASCGEAVDGVQVEESALDAYLRVREESPERVAKALVVACELDSATKKPGEAFAEALEKIEKAGVRAVGIFYGSEDADGVECDGETDGMTRRALLALEESETQQECGLLCETQAAMIMGVLIFWGLLITLLYGWGLMTDLDTPAYFGKPIDEKND